jgi:hypothetical protein
MTEYVLVLLKYMTDNPPAPLCPRCQQAMKLVRVIPRLGALPELLGFHCAPCQEARTIEATSK